MTSGRSLAENWILRSLPADQRERLRPQLRRIDLNFGTILYEAGESIRHVYFPNSGLVSLLSSTGEGQHIEVAMAGSEGMIGVEVALGSATVPYRALVQADGDAFKLEAGVVRRELGGGGQIRECMLRFASALLAEMSQSVSCNRFHTVQQRLSRWLLTAQDRTRLDRFRLSQEFLSEMLGSRRQGVNEAVGVLVDNSLISYERCCLTIVDRRGLESESCGCYSAVSQTYDDHIRASFRNCFHEVSAAGQTRR
jgi:CRP-like cAMP-binding protein